MFHVLFCQHTFKYLLDIYCKSASIIDQYFGYSEVSKYILFFKKLITISLATQTITSTPLMT